MYRQLGQAAGYVRAHGISAIRQEAMVLEYVTAHGRIAAGEVAELCGITRRQAQRLIQRLIQSRRLSMRGKAPRGAYYVLDNE
jgi:ATP-dependent DNA helicase RecG